MTFHDYLSNRDVASITWLTLAAVLTILLFPDSRSPAFSCLRQLFARKILGVIIVLICATAALAYAAEQLGVWDLTFIFPTACWFLGFVIPSFLRMNDEFPEEQYLRVLAIRVLKSVVPLGVYVSISDFPLLAEFFLVPVATFLVVLTAYVVGNPQPGWERMTRFLGGIEITFGLFMVSYTTWLIAFEPSSVDLRHQAGVLALPVWLGAGIIPLLCILRWWLALDNTFARINFEATRFASRSEPLIPGATSRAKLVVLARSFCRTSRLAGLQRDQLISVLEPASLRAAWEASTLKTPAPRDHTS